MTSLGLGKQLFLSYLLADRARRIVSYRVFTDILVQSVTSTTTSNVTSRHRGPKPKLRAGVACAALFPTLQFYLHNRLSYYVAHYISSSSVVSRALCPTRAFEVRASSTSARGGATVLKVGGQILRAKRAEKFFLTPPRFLASGGTKYCLDS